MSETTTTTPNATIHINAQPQQYRPILGTSFTCIVLLCVLALGVSGLVLVNEFNGKNAIAATPTNLDGIKIGDYVFGTEDEAGESTRCWTVGKITAFSPNGGIITTIPCKRYEKLNDNEIKNLWNQLNQFNGIKGFFLWDLFYDLRNGRVNPNDLGDLLAKAKAKEQEQFPDEHNRTIEQDN